jgi:hypothetical protein
MQAKVARLSMYSLYKCEGGVLDLTTVNLFKIFKIALVPVDFIPF